MGVVPDTVIAEIRERVDIVELVGGYVSLKRSGRNFIGLCPFHQEKTPSFNVNPERNIYHCFGCNVTGDVFQFVMEHDNLSFPEALRELAQRAGVDLAAYEGKSSAARTEFDLLYRAHEIAARLYRETLAGREGKAAREEIRRRGLPAEIVEEYRVGAAPDAWDRLLGAAHKEGIAPEMLAKGGLAIRRESKTGFYDRFRARLMFPIEAPGSKKVIGFGGRVLGEGEPKYLNSPESPLFRKRKTLYGLPQAGPALRESREALLVEGYTDVLALAAAGIRNVVASLGTSFTREHATVLSRSVDRVHVLFDSDEAGSRAAQASAGDLLASGLEVRMVELPLGEDPDSFVRSRGADALREAIASGRGVVDVLLGREAYEGGAAEERAVRRVLDALAGIDDALRRRVYVQELSNRVGVPESVLEGQLSARKPARREREEKEPAPAAKVLAAPGPRPGALESTIVGLLLSGPEEGAKLLDRVPEDALDSPVVRRILETARARAHKGEALAAAGLMEALAGDDEAIGLVGELSVSDQYSVETAKQAEDCLARLTRRTLVREVDLVKRDIRKAKADGNEQTMMDSVRRRAELAKKIAALDARNSEDFIPAGDKTR